MPKTLLIEEVRRIVALIDKGMSGRKIAQTVGVSHRTVNKIKRGDRPLFGIQYVWLDSDPQYQTVRAYRCPGCGATVTTKPCLYCTQQK